MPRRFQRPFADVPPGGDSPLNHAVMQRDAATLEMVREAVAHRQTLLAFQPVMLASDPTNVAFHEGLIRLLDPTGRVIPAKDFMPAIEDTDTGRQVDVLALRLGLNALHHHPGLRLSINMSARSIGFSDWMKTLRKGLMRDATVGERLILEITESSAMLVPELVTGFMAQMRRQGISFALDDFGAGYTSFRYLRDFLFDVLKIDGQFIRGVATDPDNQVLTSALIAIARQMDMMTIAEQVECADDAAWLEQAGIDCLQGYYYAAPTVHPPWAPSQMAAQ